MLRKCLSSMGARYSALLEKQPVITKSITAYFVITAGDLTAQSIRRRKIHSNVTEASPIDYRHAGLMGLYGLLLVAPLSHVWFNVVTKLFPVQTNTAGHAALSPWKAKWAPVLKMLTLDQLIPVPFFSYTFWIFTGAVLGDGDCSDFSGTIMRANTNFIPTLVTGYMFWPLASFINYFCVPLKFKVLYQNAAAFCWNTYLCIVSAETVNQKGNHAPRKGKV